MNGKLNDFKKLFSDVNECSPPNPCHANAQCADIQGSFTCQCNDGFAGDGFICQGKRYKGVSYELCKTAPFFLV